jgi:hypothetical protein
MAGQQLLERLRKLNSREKINWVEALPIVVDRYHDTPGESGYSPYQIMFGRERYFGNMPFEEAHTNEDAKQFFARMQMMDKKVAEIMKEKHVRFARTANVGRPRHQKYVPGTMVWYRRPPDSAGKLDSRWLGPAKITKRTGEHTDETQVSDTRRMDAHETFLKPHITDSAWGEDMPRYFHQRTRIDPKLVPAQ